MNLVPIAWTLTIVLGVLKLAAGVDISWWLVALPVIMVYTAAITILVLALALVGAVAVKRPDKLRVTRDV